MSQSGILSIAGGAPAVPTNFTTDSGPAVPVANNLNLFSADSVDNIDNGIRTIGSGDTVTVQLTNRYTGTVTTADATLTTILTIPMGATPGTFFVWGNVQAFESGTPSGATFGFSGGYRTTGGGAPVATEIGTEFHDEFKEVVLTDAEIFLAASGNNILLQVQGIAATSINWNALLEFRSVN